MKWINMALCAVIAVLLFGTTVTMPMVTSAPSDAPEPEKERGAILEEETGATPDDLLEEEAVQEEDQGQVEDGIFTPTVITITKPPTPCQETIVTYRQVSFGGGSIALVTALINLGTAFRERRRRAD